MVFLGLRGNGTSFTLKCMDNGKIDGDKYYKLVWYNCVCDLQAGNGGSLADLWRQQYKYKQTEYDLGNNLLIFGDILNPGAWQAHLKGIRGDGSHLFNFWRPA